MNNTIASDFLHATGGGEVLWSYLSINIFRVAETPSAVSV